MTATSYPPDLTEAQWTLLAPLLRRTRRARGRPPSVPRTMLNAILFIPRGGNQWRMLPKEFAPWQTVSGTFRRGQAAHLREALHDPLRALVRVAAGHRSRPTACILDSQTVRPAEHGGKGGTMPPSKPKAANAMSGSIPWG